MNVKEKTLEILESLNGGSISGEKLADMIGVSRNAVWKAVNKLKDEDHDIFVLKDGYALSKDDLPLSLGKLGRFLSDDKYKIQLYNTVNSTNTMMKELASRGEREWSVILSEEQTGGRGRLGRSFLSPRYTGIYASVLLRPNMSMSKAVFITVAAAVAAARAIEDVSGKKAEIKWVNDIYVGDRKVCGILTEASMNVENGIIDYAVLGIGINAAEPRGGFGALEGIAGALFEKASGLLRAELIALFLNYFSEYYENGFESSFEEYKRRQYLVGKEIEVISCDKTEPACAVGVDDECRLVVMMKNGEIRALSSGDVSTKRL